MKKTSIILVSLVLLSTLMFFGVRYFWKNRHEYFFKGTQPFELREQQKQGNSWWDKQETTAEAGNEEKVEKTIERPVKEYETPKIESEDCDNKCDDYDEKEELLYCQEICGFLEPSEAEKSKDTSEEQEEGVDGNECEDKNGLEKDTCYKWKAVSEKNAVFCDKISDEDLAESCQNRVIEEIF
ncbi:hypothetical protein HN784_03520 [bacterium]|jgi:hypothetical protein|nr:hypothetical protein [bacterium]MBT4251365.1 hypothetical protein [bacterium]MBT4598254.1 hypothetical protein [bacterium]MBT6754087.1 hypothetical protein [bacterium]MBT7037907.1 hypothetical protein [bacterium]